MGRPARPLDGQVGVRAGARQRQAAAFTAEGDCSAVGMHICRHVVAWVADRAGQQQHAQQQHVPRLQVRQDVGAALAGGATAEDARGVVIGCLVGPLDPVVDLVRVRVRVSGQGRG